MNTPPKPVSHSNVSCELWIITHISTITIWFWVANQTHISITLTENQVDLMSNEYRNQYGNSIFVPQNWVICFYWSWFWYINVKIKIKFQFAWFMKFQMCNKKIKHHSSVMDTCYENPQQPFQTRFVIVSLFTSLCFVSQVVTQKSRKVSYTCGFIYQLILFMICFSSINSLFLTNLRSTENHLRYLIIPKRFHQNTEGFIRSFAVNHVRRCFMDIDSFASLQLFLKQ